MLRCVTMKKIIYLLLCIVSIYSIFILIVRTTSNAEYTYGFGEYISSLTYGDDTYIEFNYMHDCYALICEDPKPNTKRYFIKYNDFFSDYFPPFDYFTFYNNEFDENSNFIIIHTTDTTVTKVYVKDDFIMPSLKYNEIDMVCMSLDAKDEDNIKNKEAIEKIVECAKSEGELELDKEIVDYIKKYSWDNHCFCLKYKGYPLVEEFHIKETEDGRYVVDQFTEEEYDTIYYDDELHYQ